MGRFFNWPPLKIYVIDADTGKPLEPNVGRKTCVQYYDIKKDKNGKKVFVGHKTGKHAENVVIEDAKKANADSKKCKCNAHGNGNNNSKDGGNKDKDAKREGEEAAVDKQNDQAKEADDGKPQEKDWTAEEDQKLREMKADNKPWADICAEFKCDKHVCQKQFKELQKAGDGKDGAKKDAHEDEGKHAGKGKGKTGNKTKEPDGGAQDSGESAKKTEKKQERASKKEQQSKPESKPPSKGASKAGSEDKGEAKFTMKEWISLQEDDIFSFGELQCISELIIKDSDQSWLRISGAFFDLTGRRVHPDDIRDKFQHMAAMG